jgi:uncharacterized protein Smg (DUF494 family)
MNEPASHQAWWSAVESIADLVHRDGFQPDEDQQLREQLTRRGFSEDVIVRAMDWIDQVALSGNLADALGMLQSAPDRIRIEHPVEKSELAMGLWRTIESCRYRGIISAELAERLVEGLRTMDTRDWDEPEVKGFLSDMLASACPTLPDVTVNEILSDRLRIRYH